MKTAILVIVLLGKSLKGKGSGDIISFQFKLLFASCSVVSVFFLILSEKKFSIFFCALEKPPTFSLCPCLFSVDINKFSKGKHGYLMKDDFFYRDRSIARQNICCCYIFPFDNCFH